MEFDLAKEGTIGLETTFGVLNQFLPLEKTIEKLTSARAIFKIQEPIIAPGNKANITLFTTTEEWIFDQKKVLSKSKNSAFLGQKLKGKVLGIYNNGKLILQDERK